MPRTPDTTSKKLGAVPLGSATTKPALADLCRSLRQRDISVGILRGAGILLDRSLAPRDAPLVVQPGQTVAEALMDEHFPDRSE